MDALKHVQSTLLLLILSNSVFATNLCDSNCELTITFPSGGSIEAIDSALFSFGTGGILDLGETGTINTAIQSSSNDYSSGGTLSLAAGESISFGINGSLNIGAGGNINYTNISLDSDGILTLTATGGNEIINLSSLTAIGTTLLNVSGSTILYDSLNLTGDLYINTSDSDTNCATNSLSSSATFHIAAPNTGITTNECNLVDSIDLNSPISLSSSNIASLLSTTISLEVYGENCVILSTTQCVTDDGTVYEFADGQWTEASEAGTLSVFLVLFLLIYLASRSHQNRQH